LFSGIGGFDLAAEWMGWQNKFHCEWNEFGQKILKHYWPGAELFTDITKSDFKKYANTIDVLTGGFPCQPYSAAGKRLGKEDERHLWPEMLRAIREVAPRYVVGENVRGLTNWNGGMVFDEVCADLENLGYQVAPYLIPACGVNAPHRRERVWFIAYCDITPTEYKISARGNMLTGQSCDGNATDTNSIRQHECKCEHEEHAGERWINALDDINANVDGGNATDTNSNGQQGRACASCNDTQRWEEQNRCAEEHAFNGGRTLHAKNWQNFPTQPPICGGNDGIPSQLDGITFPKWRNESIKAYGNAVVPQVVYQIFKAIQEHERLR
jgi:DNA (cytosine-5)-methyltransferase 1